MKAAKLKILGVAACGLGQRPWHATAEQMAPMPVLTPRATGSVGPLALEAGAGQTNWSDVSRSRQSAELHYLGRARIHPDAIEFGPPDRALASHASSVIVHDWYHADVDVGSDRAMTVVLDGAPYMLGAPDAAQTGPFDIAIRIFGGGMIDNVTASCAR